MIMSCTRAGCTVSGKRDAARRERDMGAMAERVNRATPYHIANKAVNNTELHKKH